MSEGMFVPCAIRRALPLVADRATPPQAAHRLLADGSVKITLPLSGILPDAEAKRLAWGILNDLAPDEALPTPQVVTYKEGRRLSVLHAVASGHRTYESLMTELGGSRRQIERRVQELLEDGRLIRREKPTRYAPSTFWLSTEDRS